MSNFNWNYPTTMWVGKDRINDLGKACKQLNIKKPLFVTDGGLAKTKMVSNILEKLKMKVLKLIFFQMLLAIQQAAT